MKVEIGESAIRVWIRNLEFTLRPARLRIVINEHTRIVQGRCVLRAVAEGAQVAG